MALLQSNRPYTIQSIDASRLLRQRNVEKLESDSSRQLRQRAIAKLEARRTCVPETPTPAEAHALLEEMRVHQIELEMQLQAKDGELRSSLAEKETLLKEVDHRVRNNLQVISSLLRMQAEMLKDDHRTGRALRESHQRVMSMALVHERLYAGQNLSEIDFGEYGQTLVEELSNAYPDSAGRVVFRLDTSCVLLNVGQAIPCALILNELVTNALKYAYRPSQAGEIVVALSETLGVVTLSVSDQGVGLPEGMDWRDAKSMGLAIVALLSDQIEGKLSVHSSQGTAFTVVFPKEACQPVAPARAMTA